MSKVRDCFVPLHRITANSGVVFSFFRWRGFSMGREDPDRLVPALSLGSRSVS